MSSSRVDKAQKQKVNAGDFKTTPKPPNNSEYIKDTLENADQGNEAEPPPQEQPTLTAEPKTKRKVGRPKVKQEEDVTINIAIPKSVYEQMLIAKTCFDSNLTKYVNTVITKDLENNFSTYETINNSLNSLKQ